MIPNTYVPGFVLLTLCILTHLTLTEPYEVGTISIFI